MTEYTHIDEPLADALNNLRESTPDLNTDSARAAFLAEAGVLRSRPRRLIRFPLRRMLAAASMAAVLSLAGLALSPDLRALAQSIIDFIVPGETDRREATLYVPPANMRELAEGMVPTPSPLTVEQVAEAYGDLLVPAVLPENYRFDEGSYLARADLAGLSYACAPYRITLFQQPMTEAELAEMTPYQAGASAIVQEVQIGDATGQYVRGWWWTEYDESVLNAARAAARESEEPVQLEAENVWSNDIEFHQLVWYADSTLFTIVTDGGILSRGPDLSQYSRCLLTLDELAAMANSLGPVQ